MKRTNALGITGVIMIAVGLATIGIGVRLSQAGPELDPFEQARNDRFTTCTEAGGSYHEGSTHWVDTNVTETDYTCVLPEWKDS